jgi:hypothetical protein
VTVPLCDPCHDRVHDMSSGSRSDSTSALTKQAMQRKVARGEYNGGQPPFGTRVAADGVMLEPDPDEQATIAAARVLRLTGLNNPQIALELSRLGHRSRRGGDVGRRSIGRMLVSRPPSRALGQAHANPTTRQQ